MAKSKKNSRGIYEFQDPTCWDYSSEFQLHEEPIFIEGMDLRQIVASGNYFC